MGSDDEEAVPASGAVDTQNREGAPASRALLQFVPFHAQRGRPPCIRPEELMSLIVLREEVSPLE